MIIYRGNDKGIKNNRINYVKDMKKNINNC